MPSITDSLKKKLDIEISRVSYLREQHAIVSDANLKFTLNLQIKESESEIKALESRISESNKASSIIYPTNSRKKIAVVGLSILSILILFILVQYYKWINTKEEKDIVWPINDEIIRIGVLPFKEVCEYNSQSFDVGYVIADRLRRLIKLNEMSVEVRYLDNIEIGNNFDAKQAKKILNDYKLDQLVFGAYISENCYKSNGYCINYISSDSLKMPFSEKNRYSGWKYATFEEIQSGFLQEELDVVIYWLAALNCFYSDEKRFRSIEYLNILESSYGMNSVHVYNLRGYAYLLEQKDTLAHQDFTRSLEVVPVYSDILYLRGSLSANLFSDIEGAIQDYNKSLQIDSSDAFVYYLRGQMFFELDKFDSTIFDMKKHLELAPQSYNAFYYLASSYMIKEDYNKAKLYAIKCLSNCDRSMIGYSHLLLGQIMFNSNSGTMDSIVNSLDSAVKYQPDLLPVANYYKERLSGKTIDETKRILIENGLYDNFKKIGKE